MADLAKTIRDAEIDARSLSEFIYKPASFMVSRRLAPAIHTLDYYLRKLDGIEQQVQDAINNTAVEGGVLADTFITVTPNGVGTVARTQRDKNSDLVSVFDYGAVGDGLTDDTDAIKAALADVNYAYFPEGKTYIISDEIVMPPFSSIFSTTGRATIVSITSEKNMVVIPEKGHIEYINFISDNNYIEGDYTKAIINAPVGKPYNPNKISVQNCAIQGGPQWIGPSAKNAPVGILMGGNGGGGQEVGISGSVFHNITFLSLQVAILTENIDRGYVTANYFSNFSIGGCYTGIWINGGGSNFFNTFMYNHNGFALYPIRISKNGQFNDFDGFFYDMGQGDAPNRIAVFEDNAQFNKVNTLHKGGYIVDNTGPRNNMHKVDHERVTQVIRDAMSIPYDWLAFEDAYKIDSYPYFKPYMGHQDNILAYADKLHKVTLNGSDSIGGLHRVFDPTRKNGSASTHSGRNVIEITLQDNLPFNCMDYMQIVFDRTYEAEYIKIEGLPKGELESGNWTTVLEETSNDKRYVTASGNMRGNSFGSTKLAKLRITLDRPNNENYTILAIVGRFITSVGNTFIPRNGGTVVGDLDFHDSNTGVTMLSPDGARWRLSVDNSGNISANSVN